MLHYQELQHPLSTIPFNSMLSNLIFTVSKINFMHLSSSWLFLWRKGKAVEIDPFNTNVPFLQQDRSIFPGFSATATQKLLLLSHDSSICPCSRYKADSHRASHSVWLASMHLFFELACFPCVEHKGTKHGTAASSTRSPWSSHKTFCGLYSSQSHYRLASISSFALTKVNIYWTLATCHMFYVHCVS